MRRILIAALAIMLVGTAVIGGGIGLAVAQEEDTPIESFLGRVAEKLGIGEDELRSAMTEAEQDVIDERVVEGKLTAEQGEALKERIGEKGLLGPLGGPVDGPRDQGRIRDRLCDRVFDCIRKRVCNGASDCVDGRVRDHTVEAAATVLGLELEELVDELKNGKTLAEVAEEKKGMAVDEFTAAMLPEVRQELDALVAEGKLTEEQADAIYGHVEENIDRIVNAQGRLPDLLGPRGGPLGGPCPRGAFFEGAAPVPSVEPTESSIEA
jgi:polyhydroxyalkanoate synthesis regulator phasin